MVSLTAHFANRSIPSTARRLRIDANTSNA
jgi:hypothetical protein